MKVIHVTKDNTKQSIQETIENLQAGGLIIYPTETCYGVGVDATNPKAVARLLAYKKRPEGKAISIAVVDRKMAKKYVNVNEIANNIYQNLLPGPITVISKSLGNTAKELEAEDNTIGIRIPDHPFTRKLIKQFGRPITATSANISGKKTPYCIQDIKSNASNKQLRLIDLVLDLGQLPKNPPSTVVNTVLNDLALIRKGAIDINQLNKKTSVTNSESKTREIGEQLIQDHKPVLAHNCLIIALQGELGAGKTQLTKGIAKGLGIKEVVTSPTYLLVKEYGFNNNELYHIDTWRMEEGIELKDLGLKDMLIPGNVVVVEWLEKVRKTLDKLSKKKGIKIIWVTIEHKGKTKRKLSLSKLL